MKLIEIQGIKFMMKSGIQPKGTWESYEQESVIDAPISIPAAKSIQDIRAEWVDDDHLDLKSLHDEDINADVPMTCMETIKKELERRYNKTFKKWFGNMMGHDKGMVYFVGTARMTDDTYITYTIYEAK